jgi:selenide,water dikinase
LAQVLRPIEALFAAEHYPDLLVGLGAQRDDAAVYKLTDDRALIVTLDFFTPVVDDPFHFGAIAAVNSMSDVYAMGGNVTLALNIACLSGCLPPEVVGEILRGGATKVIEAGGVLVGGHSVNDSEPKFGMVVLGFVHPRRIWTKRGAQVGDALILTKSLGVGIITTAAKADQAADAHVEAAIASMLKLNRAAAELLQTATVRACTDVTGFALLGHACEMAERGGVRLRLRVGQLPLLPGAAEYADQWLFPCGTINNREAFRPHVHCAAGIPEETEHLLYTPETSGGLLAAISPDELPALQERFAAAREPLHVIGEVLPAADDCWIELEP